MILLSIFSLMIFSATGERWHNLERFEDMSAEVQSHLQTVIAEKYTRLYWDMYQSCNGTHKPQVVIHLQIVNVQDQAEVLEKTVHWEVKTSPCSISLYSALDTVLEKWCMENPDRMLTFPYTNTKEDFWTNDPNFLVAIQTRCHQFIPEIDLPRLPLPPPFDVRQDRFSKFLVYFIPSVVLIIILLFIYANRSPYFENAKARWINYWERKEREKIIDIIEYRYQLINEEKQKKMMEKSQEDEEDNKTENISLDMEC